MSIFNIHDYFYSIISQLFYWQIILLDAIDNVFI